MTSLYALMPRPPLLLDLAVLYRALSFGTDADLDPAEVETMRELLGSWVPGEDPARVDHVMREAALVNVNALSLGDVLERIGEGLRDSARARVLSDLRRIAVADGRVTQGEEDLLTLVERALGE